MPYLKIRSATSPTQGTIELHFAFIYALLFIFKVILARKLSYFDNILTKFTYNIPGKDISKRTQKRYPVINLNSIAIGGIAAIFENNPED